MWAWKDTVQTLLVRGLDSTVSQLLCSLLVFVPTWFAVKLGYGYVLAQWEEAVDFPVPKPQELSSDWQGKQWEEITGKDKEILEGQAKGVSCSASA